MTTIILYQCCHKQVVRNKFQSNRNWNSNIFILEITLECPLQNGGQFSKPQYVNVRNHFVKKEVSWHWESLIQVNSIPPGQNGCHFTDYIFKCIFINAKFFILLTIPLKIVPRGLIDNKSALVQAMACHWTDDNPLSELVLTQFIDAYMRLSGEMS